MKNTENLKGLFDNPEELPSNEEKAKQLQNANKQFWEKNSMRYDWRETIPYPEFSIEFYNEIDKRFLGASYSIMPWKSVPFEQWLDIPSLGKKDVLEIGVGNGTHAEIISSRAKTYTGIDLTEYAIKSTQQRFRLKELTGTILQMDAEKLNFQDASFDLVWSWGVIHHSSNTSTILGEIHRVLKPGGKAVIMVYYRSWWSYYFGGALLGLFRGGFFKGKTLHQINQDRTDGALARYYTFKSWSDFVKDRFRIIRMETLGNKADIVPLPSSKVKTAIVNSIPYPATKVMLKNLKMGSFLICEMIKK